MMEIVTAVGKKDVVIGYKGSIKREYPGNNLLTKYLEEKRSDYFSESLKPGYKTGRWKKTAVVNKIINILENEGGRFLKRNRENNNMYSIIIKKEIKSAFIRNLYRVSYQPLHCTHMNHPLVPPDDCTLEEYDTRLASSRTHRLYVKGTSYCNDITDEKWNILDCREETKGQYTLKIKLPVGMLIERKHYLSTEEESILHYMNLSGEVSTIEKFNAAVIKLKSFPCRDCTMAAVGRPRKGAVMTDNAHVPGEERPFAVHRNNPTFIDLWKTAIVSFKKTLDQYFPDILQEFAEKRKKGGWKIMEDVGGEEHGISSTQDVSIDLVNESHFDNADGTRGISMWTELKHGNARNWYFLLPDCHINGDMRPIALKLFSGATIVWDGRRVKHCSTGNVSNGNHIYGNFCGEPNE